MKRISREPAAFGGCISSPVQLVVVNITSLLIKKIAMKSVVVASLVASTAAFAPPSQQSRVSTELNEFCKGYVGGESVEPMFVGDTGSKNFDPLGLTTVGLICIS